MDDTFEASTTEASSAAETVRRGVLAPGSHVGRYVVHALIAEGGMGSVYRAHDPGLNRPVAVKVLRVSEWARAEAQRRLLREAQILAQLSHPNVVSVFDVGPVDNGLFVAMEFVEGQTLWSWMQKSRSWPEIVDVFMAAGRGLQAAHEMGLIHRDFKPANVMVGNDGRIRVLDFGLACSELELQPNEQGEAPEGNPPTPSPGVRDDAAVDASLRTITGETLVREEAERLLSHATENGTAMGTPAYMAPEQHLGVTMDAHADQFSFAVTLYQALYGEFPFGLAPAMLLRRVLNGEVEPAPKSTQVPTRVRRVLLRALSTRPEDRYPLMAEMLSALGRARNLRRRRVISAAVGGSAILALAIGLFFAFQTPDCTLSEDTLDAAWGDAQRMELTRAFSNSGVSFALDTAARVVDKMDAYARHANATFARACRETMVEKDVSPALYNLRYQCVLDRVDAMGRLALAMSDQPDLEVVTNAIAAVEKLPAYARCHDFQALQASIEPPTDLEMAEEEKKVREGLKEADTLLTIGRYQEAHRRAVAFNEQVADWDYPPIHAATKSFLAETQALVGKHRESRKTAAEAMIQASLADDTELLGKTAFWFFRTAKGPSELEGWTSDLAIAAAAQGKHPEDQGRYHQSLGRLHSLEGRYGDAEKSIRRALELLEQEGKPPLVMLEVKNDLMLALWAQGEVEQVLAGWKQVLEDVIQETGPEHPNVASSRNNLAAALSQLGKYAETAAQFRKALAINLKVLGPQHPTVAQQRNNLSFPLREMGKYTEAETQSRKAVSIVRNKLGEEHAYAAMYRGNLSVVLRELGKYAEAIAEARTSLEITAKVLGPEHPELANAHSKLSLALVRTRATSKALYHARLSVELAEKILGKEDGKTARYRRALAAALLRLGKRREALAEYKEALRVASAKYPARNPYVVEIRVGLAETLASLGQRQKALKQVIRVLELGLPNARNDVKRARALQARLGGGPPALGSAQLVPPPPLAQQDPRVSE